MVLKTSVEQPHSPGTECPSACFRMQIWMNFKKCNIDIYVIFQSWILVFSIIVDKKKAWPAPKCSTMPVANAFMSSPSVSERQSSI